MLQFANFHSSYMKISSLPENFTSISEKNTGTKRGRKVVDTGLSILFLIH